MAKSSKEAVWYGRLETSKSNSIIIRDDDLPEAPAGRVYLYNADRDQIIEYVETIVRAKLKPLSEEDRQALGTSLEKKFQAARKLFIKEVTGRANVYNLKSESAAKVTKAAKVEEKIERVDLPNEGDDLITLDDDAGDDWDEEDSEESA